MRGFSFLHRVLSTQYLDLARSTRPRLCTGGANAQAAGTGAHGAVVLHRRRGQRDALAAGNAIRSRTPHVYHCRHHFEPARAIHRTAGRVCGHTHAAPSSPLVHGALAASEMRHVRSFVAAPRAGQEERELETAADREDRERAVAHGPAAGGAEAQAGPAAQGGAPGRAQGAGPHARGAGAPRWSLRRSTSESLRHISAPDISSGFATCLCVVRFACGNTTAYIRGGCRSAITIFWR